jgi:Lipocalin-like domain
LAASHGESSHPMSRPKLCRMVFRPFRALNPRHCDSGEFGCVATSFAYVGRYSLSGDNATHHIEVSSVENRVNTALVRLIKFDGDRLLCERRQSRSEAEFKRPN